MPRTACTPLLLIVAAASGLLAGGCTSLASVSRWFDKVPVADANHPVMDLSCIWQQGTGRTPEGLPCRGFCGQLMFVTAGNRVPAIVNGHVAIYVFDNVGGVNEQSKPLSVFEFTPQEWAQFARRTNLGMTYQLFVPYMRRGEHRAECHLRVKYTPAEGGMPLLSQPTLVTLPGDGSPSRNATPALPEPTIPQAAGLPAAATGPDSAFAALALKMQEDRQLAASDPRDPHTGVPQSLAEFAVSADPRRQRLQAGLERASGSGR
ncbi:MAG: hypothetical protein KF774_18635 [Planctomyces sp.]|nr:hypothetical protein [Planctomyces sp.]